MAASGQERQTRRQSGAPGAGQASARRGRTPWRVTLLLLGVFAALFAGLFLLWSQPGRAPSLFAFAAPTATPRPAVTATPQPAPTARPDAAADAAAALPPGLRFTLDPATIEYVPRAGRCDWVGVAGRVERSTGEGVPGLRVHVQRTGSDGEQQARTDGSGNFELRLGEVPVLAPWQVHLRSADGAARSEVTQFVTSAYCDQNLVLLFFREQP